MSKLVLATRTANTKGRAAMLTFALYFPASLAILFQDSISLEFGDQGRKLLGGFAVAVVAVIAFTVIRFRRRDKNPPKHFISVTSTKEEVPSKPADD